MPWRKKKLSSLKKIKSRRKNLILRFIRSKTHHLKDISQNIDSQKGRIDIRDYRTPSFIKEYFNSKKETCLEDPPLV